MRTEAGLSGPWVKIAGNPLWHRAAEALFCTVPQVGGYEAREFPRRGPVRMLCGREEIVTALTSAVERRRRCMVCHVEHRKRMELEDE